MEEYNLKYALNHLSKRFKTMITTGTLVLVGTIGVGSLLSGCNKHDNKENDTNNDIVSDITSEETAEKVVEITTETTNDENAKEYNLIDNMEEDIVDFAKANLPNGFIEVNEDNKLERAKMFTDAYVMMNLSSNEGQITPATVAILNQNNILIPTEVKDNYKDFAYITGEYMLRVEPSTQIDFELFVQEKDDAKFLNNLENEIANMNVAKTAEERQEKINNIIAIKDSILTNASTTTYSSSTIYMAINMIIEADAKARAYGNEVFPDEEAKLQLYTTLSDICIEEANEFGYETSIASQVASTSSFESIYFTSASEKITFAISKESNKTADKYYSYEEVTKRISEKILGLYIAPAMTNIDAENAVRASLDAQLTPAVGSSTTKEIDPSAVPESAKVPTTESHDYSDAQTTEDADKIEDSSKSNDVYIRAKGAGIKDGSADAASLYTSSYAGHASDMPSKSVGSAPSESEKNYNVIYTYFYNVSWNEFRSSAIAAEAQAQKENEQSTTEFQPVDGPEKKKTETTEQVTTEATTQQKTTESKIEELSVEQITEKTTETTTQTTTEATTQATTEAGTYFEPVNDAPEEQIEEIIENVTSKISTRISVLKSLREQVIDMYINAYNDYDNTKSNVKRV